jgi:membrane protease YdiL (CAAX protease family)
MSLATTNFIAEMSMFVPALIFILCTGDRFIDMFPVRKIRLQTALLVPVYLILIMPLCFFANSVTMLFVENTVASISGEILSMSLPLMVGSIGIFAPIVEELCYRGILFHSYKRTGRVVAAIVLSAILFGLMHMNLNQAAYAFLLGLMFAVLVEATGSILPSMIAHMLLNSSQVLMMYWESNGGADLLEEAANYTSEEVQQSLLASIGPLAVIALIGAGIAICLAYYMSKLENRSEYFANILKIKPPVNERGKKMRIVTVPLILGMGVCVALIVVLMFA